MCADEENGRRARAVANVFGVATRRGAGGAAVANLLREVDGEGEVKAGDVMASSDFEIVNPELHLLSLDSAESRVSIEMNVEQGTGYIPAAHETGLPIGVLPVDAVYTPVRKAGFKVESTRVGQKTNYDRLILDLWTDSTISPEMAMVEAAKAWSVYWLAGAPATSRQRFWGSL